MSTKMQMKAFIRLVVFSPSVHVNQPRHGRFRHLCVGIVALVWCLLVETVAAADKCPDLASLRSANVTARSKEQVASLMSGFWYELGYEDVAQIGASCQTQNITTTDQHGGITADFAVKYGQIPFHIDEQYTADEVSTGIWTKMETSFPGSKLIQLPTALVDVTPSTFILYSCLNDKRLPPVTELVIAGRGSAMGDETFNSLLRVAQALGVPINASQVKRVDHSGC